MKVYALDYLGKTCISPNPLEVTDWAMEVLLSQEHDDADPLILSRKEMTQDEVDALPEFEGY